MYVVLRLLEILFGGILTLLFKADVLFVGASS